MEEKKYLKWYNKVGYGSGDIAGNVVYAFLTSFIMVYLTDTVGLASGIVGTLIAFSKLFDGFTDIFFGSMIDKTHSKLGKARPWMLYGYVGCAITLIACFAKVCSSCICGYHSCGSRRMSTKGEFVEILEFTHFARIFKFNRTPGIGKKKEIFHEVKVSVGLELV